jgi:hypothetical protein
VRRNRGHPCGETVATSGAFQWPPMGSFPWPPSASLLLKPLQPILMLFNPRRQLETELDTPITTRVIDRLRLGTLHACKISLHQQGNPAHGPDDRTVTV